MLSNLKPQFIAGVFARLSRTTGSILDSGLKSFTFRRYIQAQKGYIVHRFIVFCPTVQSRPRKKIHFHLFYFIFNRTALFDSERHLVVVIQSKYDKSQPFCLARANNYRGCTKYLFLFSFFHFHFLSFLYISLGLICSIFPRSCFLVILHIYKHFLYSISFFLNFLKTSNSEVNLKAFSALLFSVSPSLVLLINSCKWVSCNTDIYLPVYLRKNRLICFIV